MIYIYIYIYDFVLSFLLKSIEPNTRHSKSQQIQIKINNGFIFKPLPSVHIII